MALTDSQQDAILNALENVMKGPIVCPLSKDSDWQVQNHLAMIPATDDATVALSGTSFPTAVLLCQNCGYTLLVNLYSLGLAEYFELMPEVKPHGS